MCPAASVEIFPVQRVEEDKERKILQYSLAARFVNEEGGERRRRFSRRTKARRIKDFSKCRIRLIKRQPTRRYVKRAKGEQKTLRRAARAAYLARFGDDDVEKPYGAMRDLFRTFCRQWNVNPPILETTFYYWCKTPELGRGRAERLPGGGRKAVLKPQDEAILSKALGEASDQGMSIPVDVLQGTAAEMLTRKGVDVADLKFSRSWVRGFLSRAALSVRTPEQVNHANRPRSKDQNQLALRYHWLQVLLQRKSAFACEIFQLFFHSDVQF